LHPDTGSGIHDQNSGEPVTWDPGCHELALEGPETWRCTMLTKQIFKASLLSSRDVMPGKNLTKKLETLGKNMCSLTSCMKISKYYVFSV
jgi:hypothetical protein